MSANVEYLVPRFTQMRDQLLFSFKARMVGGNSYTHVVCPR
jgi:hypothetical protein